MVARSNRKHWHRAEICEISRATTHPRPNIAMPAKAKTRGSAAKTKDAKKRAREPQQEASIAATGNAPPRDGNTPRAKIEVNSELLAHAHVSKAWPFEEARKVLSRLKRLPKPTGAIIFETGYGPSGLPHIGTFGEVARTTMVRHAFRVLTEDKVPTRLICFSDDMDGLRKVPDNIPNKEMVAEHLGKPLTQVPDPFGDHPSFGQHNNARLKAFLDTFGFDYEFLSATECYTTGRFDKTLLKVLEHYDAVRDVILPTLGPERRATYSPFLPISPVSGQVLQVPIIDRDLATGTIFYKEPETGKLTQVPVTRGHCKLQWKADWAMRWAALGVDYEMAGKDLIDSVRLSGHICRILGAQQPEGFNYELFLDENGEKISKSRGNGLTIEEWLDLRLAGEPFALHVSEPAESEAALFRRHPARRRRICRPPRRLPEGGAGGEADESRCGTFIPASRRRPTCRSASGCCSISPAPRTPRTRRCCGASSAAMPPRRRPNSIRSSISSWATPFATSMTS